MYVKIHQRDVIKKIVAKVVHIYKKMVKVSNTYKYIPKDISSDSLMHKIKQIEEFQRLISLAADSGVHKIIGELQCGIILKDESKEIRVKLNLHTMNLDRETDAEMVSIAAGLNMLSRAKK